MINATNRGSRASRARQPNIQRYPLISLSGEPTRFHQNRIIFHFAARGRKWEVSNGNREREREMVRHGERDGENSPFIVECLLRHNLNGRADRAE